jgi:hypothetical protein
MERRRLGPGAGHWRGAGRSPAVLRFLVLMLIAYKRIKIILDIIVNIVFHKKHRSAK